MSETPHAQDEPQSASVTRRIRWDALAAIIAALVGLLALLVAGYTAYIERQQVRAQVWPYLIGGVSGHKNELVWINKGVGPAIVRGVEITIGGKPQGDWGPVMRTLGLRVAYHQSFLNGNVISPGETIPWLQFDNEADYANFMRFEQRPDFRIDVCYCSALGECWRTEFGNTSRHAVAQCPALPESRQFHD